MDQLFFVYLLTFASGKVYVGMSKTDKRGLFTLRYNNHAAAARRGVQLPVYSAWRKYGAPKLEILSIHDDRQLCAIAEIDEIEKRNSTDRSNGYNIAKGGQGNDSGSNPVMYKWMRERVWDNPKWRKSVSDGLKGRPVSQATKDAYIAWCKNNPEKKAELARRAWLNPEYKKKRSEATKTQMKNGGADHLSRIMIGRIDPRSEEGKMIQIEKAKAYMATPEGKAAARKGYESFAANPENIKNNQAALDKWRKSDKNAEQCREMAKKAAEACSKKIQFPDTGEAFNSQREAAKSKGVSEACISRWVKAGKCVRI